MNARHPGGVDSHSVTGASGVDVAASRRAPAFEALQPSVDLRKDRRAAVNSRVTQARKSLATGRKQALALSGGDRVVGDDDARTVARPAAAGGAGAPPPVRRPAPASASAAGNNRPPPADFRRGMDARKAELAAEKSRLSAALHSAVRSGDAGSTRRLLDSGASVNAADRDGRTPLLNASAPAVVSVLVAAGARYTSGIRGGTGNVRAMKIGVSTRASPPTTTRFSGNVSERLLV